MTRHQVPTPVSVPARTLGRSRAAGRRLSSRAAVPPLEVVPRHPRAAPAGAWRDPRRV